MSTADGGLPSSHATDVWSQPEGTVCETETAEPGTRLLNVRELASVASLSSSSEKLTAPAEVEALNAKSCASFGVESCTTTRRPRLRLANVQVTVSPEPTSMFDTGLPSLQVAAVWSQPVGTVSAAE